MTHVRLHIGTCEREATYRHTYKSCATYYEYISIIHIVALYKLCGLGYFVGPPCIGKGVHHAVREGSKKVVLQQVIHMFLIVCCTRSFIYPYLMGKSRSVPLDTFIPGFFFCLYNGFMQGRYLLSTTYPINWMFQIHFISGNN